MPDQKLKLEDWDQIDLLSHNFVDFEGECATLREQLKKTKEQNDDLRELIQNLKADLAVAEIELDHYRYQEE